MNSIPPQCHLQRASRCSPRRALVYAGASRVILEKHKQLPVCSYLSTLIQSGLGLFLVGAMIGHKLSKQAQVKISPADELLVFSRTKIIV